MEDRHAKEIAQGLKSIASALGGVAFAIFMGAMYIQCAISMHHP
jgi:hypothetical protein